jgi:protein-S-isoprenylcysteine O-methyltransferase Ste14
VYSLKLNYGTLAAAAVGCGVVVERFWDLPWNGMHEAGLAVMAPSFAMLVAARLQLGRSFTVGPKANRLVTSGIYSKVRNPIYVSSLLLLAGTALWVEKPWFLLGLLVLIPLQVLRSREEARVLEDRFGQAYCGVPAADVDVVAAGEAGVAARSGRV